MHETNYDRILGDTWQIVIVVLSQGCVKFENQQSKLFIQNTFT